MPFKPLEEILGPIALPINGKTYTLPVVSLEDGLRLHAILSGEDKTETFATLYNILLGDAYQQMCADGVNYAYIDRAFHVALTEFRAGREAAEEVWENGLPKGYSDLVQAAVQKAMTLQDAEPTTLQPDSTNGTNATKAKGARGKKS